MRFITEENEPTFADVEQEQFFVNDEGCLFQKINSERANQIANSDGRPCAISSIYFSQKCRIDRICPKVTKIEF